MRRTWIVSAAWFAGLVWSGVVDNRRQGSPPESVGQELISFLPVTVALVVLVVLGMTGVRRSGDRRWLGAFGLLVIAGVSQLGAVAWLTINRVTTVRGDAHEPLLLNGVAALITAVVWLLVLRRRAEPEPVSGPPRSRAEWWGPACYLVVFGLLSVLAVSTLLVSARVPNAIADVVLVLALLGWLGQRCRRGFARLASPPVAASASGQVLREDQAGFVPVRDRRFARSWRLTRIAWRLLRSDATMLVLTVISGVATIAATLVVFWLSGWLEGPGHAGRLALISALLAWPLTFVSTFLGFALAAAGAVALDGGRLTPRQALAVAGRRVGQIALWSLLVAGIGIVLRLIAERLPLGGRLATWLLGAAWGLVTFFAIPILALEGCSAGHCVKRSSELIRRRWGEGIIGTVTIAAWTVIAILPAAFLIGTASAFSRPTRVVLIVGALVVMLIIWTLAGAAHQVYALALYRYATTDDVTAGFDQSDLQHPFTQPRRWLRPS